MSPALPSDCEGGRVVGARSFPSAEAPPLSLEAEFPIIAYLGKNQRRVAAELETAWSKARRFRREFVEPNALAIDRRTLLEPEYVAEDVLRGAADHGLLGLVIPQMFGGSGLSLGALMVALEEVSAGCVGIANLISVHGLALAAVTSTGDLRAMERACKLVTDGEQRRRPALLSTALTEPGAGTDVEDVELLRTARIGCEARPVAGGYLLNGRKVFISNGSIAEAHVVIMPTDRARPVETTYAFLVRAGTPGLSIGRVERKMGQKACPAAELVFEDCFVEKDTRLGSRPIAGRRLEMVLGATRGGVGVFGAGVARGAYERALAYARTHELGGRPMIEHQWVQFRLVDMLRNVMMARSAYVDAMLSNELFGLSALMSGGPIRELSRWIPRSVLEGSVFRRVVLSRRAHEETDAALEEAPPWQTNSSCAFGAEAKILGSDLAMENSNLALDLMGADGLRHDSGMEKLFRDAKLLQIYEGTNQLNRIEIFKTAVAPNGG